MAHSNTIVEIEGVTFAYASANANGPVLDDVSLRIDPHDFLGVIGPNGGGKTTLLKIMLGLLAPQRGRVSVFGRPPAEVRASIGYVPQHAQIDPTVPANVLDVVLTGRLGRAPWGAMYRRSHVDAAREALRQTQTEDLITRPLATLSGGQRQRVLIARALAGDAKLLLLDEPTASVDPQAERDLTNLLHQLNEKMPIVLVSHDISFVSTHLKRVACLNQRLTCHATHEIDDNVIAQMYRGHMRSVHHPHDCTLADPGCEQNHGDT